MTASELRTQAANLNIDTNGYDLRKPAHKQALAQAIENERERLAEEAIAMNESILTREYLENAKEIIDNSEPHGVLLVSSWYEKMSVIGFAVGFTNITKRVPRRVQRRANRFHKALAGYSRTQPTAHN